jgi:hypothetical protein
LRGGKLRVNTIVPARIPKTFQLSMILVVIDSFIYTRLTEIEVVPLVLDHLTHIPQQKFMSTLKTDKINQP